MMTNAYRTFHCRPTGSCDWSIALTVKFSSFYSVKLRSEIRPFMLSIAFKRCIVHVIIFSLSRLWALALVLWSTVERVVWRIYIVHVNNSQNYITIFCRIQFKPVNVECLRELKPRQITNTVIPHRILSEVFSLYFPVGYKIFTANRYQPIYLFSHITFLLLQHVFLFFYSQSIIYCYSWINNNIKTNISKNCKLLTLTLKRPTDQNYTLYRFIIYKLY